MVILFYYKLCSCYKVNIISFIRNYFSSVGYNSAFGQLLARWRSVQLLLIERDQLDLQQENRSAGPLEWTFAQKKTIPGPIYSRGLSESGPRTKHLASLYQIL